MQADAEVAERGPAVRKEKDIARRHIAVNHPLTVGVGQAVEDLGDNPDDSADGHWFGAVGERAHGQLGRQDSVAADHISILDRHDMGMAQSSNQSYFAEQGLVVTLTAYVGQRYLQGHPDALDTVPGLPDLAASSFAEGFCKPILAQSLTAFEVHTRQASSLAFGRIS